MSWITAIRGAITLTSSCQPRTRWQFADKYERLLVKTSHGMVLSTGENSCSPQAASLASKSEELGEALVPLLVFLRPRVTAAVHRTRTLAGDVPATIFFRAPP
jgi:hypothetical protein